MLQPAGSTLIAALENIFEKLARAFGAGILALSWPFCANGSCSTVPAEFPYGHCHGIVGYEAQNARLLVQLHAQVDILIVQG